MKQKAAGFSQFLTFLVFALLSVCTLLLLLSGAGVYRRIAQRSSEADASRTAARYLTTRVHQSERGASVEPFGDTEALVLRETVADRTYLTRVYCYEGYLMELYTAAEGDFAPSDGEKLFPVEALSFSETDNLLQVTVTLPHGESQTLTFFTGWEVLP